jgi:peptide/nickel transport system substrate-binding protein
MRIPSRIMITVALISILVVLIAGCSKTSPTTTATNQQTSIVTSTTAVATSTATTTKTTTAPASTTAAGSYGTIRIADSIFGDESFDPATRSSVTLSQIQLPIYDSLVRLDQNGKLAPGVADKWTMSADGLSWLYNIHPGIKFSNGDALTATDVKFSIDRFAGADAFNPQTRTAVKSVEVVDPLTVKVNTNGVQVYLPYNQTLNPPHQGLISSKAYWDKVGLDGFNNAPIGSGPYTLTKHVAADSLEYNVVANYWRGTPAYKTMQLVLVPEAVTRIAMLRTGSADLIEGGDIDQVAPIEAAGFKTLNGVSQMDLIMLSGTYMPAAKSMAVSDVRVRQALSLAINRTEISQVLFSGKAGPPLPGRLGPDTTDIDLARWNKWIADNYGFDPARAKQLLAAAGWANGFNIKVYLYQANGMPEIPKLGQVIQSYWKNIGVTADLVAVDETTYKKYRAGPDPQIIGTGVIQSAGFNPQSTTPMSVGYLNKGGSYRLFATSATESAIDLDSQFAAIDSQPDVAKRQALFDSLIQQVADTYTALELCSLPALYHYNSKTVTVSPDHFNPIRSLAAITDSYQHPSK